MAALSPAHDAPLEMSVASGDRTALLHAFREETEPPSSPPLHGTHPAAGGAADRGPHDRENAKGRHSTGSSAESARTASTDEIPPYPPRHAHRTHDSGGRHSVDSEDGGHRPRYSMSHARAHSQGTLHLATATQKRALWWRSAFVTGMFILSWYTFATMLSLYNKWMFDPAYYGFSYPLFVSACHMIVQFTCAAVIRMFWAQQFRPAERPTRKEYGTRVFPTAAATGADIGLSNLSLKTITLSLYTMCKSSALIFVLVFAFLFKLEKFSLRLIAVIMLISLGVFLMVFNVTAVSIPGIVMVFCASAIGGLRWALTELIMHKKAMGLSNPFATIFWMAPLMGLVLGVVSLCIESWHDIFTSEYFANPLVTIKSISIILLPGALAFSMVASEYFILVRAGVVPLSVAGIFKEVTTILFSSWAFGDQLTTLNAVGVGVTVIGIALYSFHKYSKSMNSEVPLDARGDPIEDVEERECAVRDLHEYQRAAQDDRDAIDGLPSPTDGRVGPDGRSEGLPMTSLSSPPQSQHPSHSARRSSSSSSSDAAHDEATRLRDEFEGWDTVGVSDDESEAADDEVARRRVERDRPTSGLRTRWHAWWDRSM